jgi:hypothetical protein
MTHEVRFSKQAQSQLYSTDAVSFTAENGEKAFILVSSYAELADKIGWENKINLIKIIRGIASWNGDRLNLLFAKQIVEWFYINRDRLTA